MSPGRRCPVLWEWDSGAHQGARTSLAHGRGHRGKGRGTSQIVAADPGEATEIAFTIDGAGVQGPDSVSAGWVRISFENKGNSDRHMALVQLTGGKTAGDLRSFIEQDPSSPLPEWALPSGGPADTSPGVTAVVTQNLQEGSYVWVTYVLARIHRGRASG